MSQVSSSEQSQYIPLSNPYSYKTEEEKFMYQAVLKKPPKPPAVQPNDTSTDSRLKNKSSHYSLNQAS